MPAAVFDSGTGRAVQPPQAMVRNLKTVKATFTRPADTTTYTIGDVVGPVTTPAAQSFPSVARGNGGTGKVVRVTLETNNPTVTLGTFRWHFFNSVVVPAADNAAFLLHTIAGAAGINYVGYVDPPIVVADYATATGVVSRLTAGIDAAKGIPLDYQCAAAGSGLWVVLVALGAYVPISGQVFNLAVTVEMD